MLERFTVPIHDERKQFLANKMYYAHAQFAHVEDTEEANVLVALLYLKIGHHPSPYNSKERASESTRATSFQTNCASI